MTLDRFKSYFDDRDRRVADEEDLDYAFEQMNAVIATTYGDSIKLAAAQKLLREAYDLALDAVDDIHMEIE